MKRVELKKKSDPTVKALKDLTQAGRDHVKRVAESGVGDRVDLFNKMAGLEPGTMERRDPEEFYVPTIEEKRGAVERAIDMIANQPSVIEHFTEGQLDILILVLGVGEINLKD